MECIEEEIYMTKRLLNANVSDIVNFSNEELKQSIKANEGRTVLSENVVIHEPLIPNITNSEVAKSFGADLILLNAFDVFNPIVLGMYDYSTMDKAVPNDNVVTDLKKYTGRPIGLNLEPVDLEAEMAEEKLEIAEGRKATKETLEKLSVVSMVKAKVLREGKLKKFQQVKLFWMILFI